MEIKQIKEAITNPPQERLARIEYQSHLFQMFGIILACSVLLWKGFWYIVFALIFGVGVSYVGYINAYRKYKLIKQYLPEQKPEELLNEKSFTRRRASIVNWMFRFTGKPLAGILALGVTILCVSPSYPRWALSMIYPPMFVLLYVFIYYWFLYWIALPVYKVRVKGG